MSTIIARFVTLERVNSVVTVFTISTAISISSQRSIALPISSRTCVYTCFSDFFMWYSAFAIPRSTPQKIMATPTISRKSTVKWRKSWVKFIDFI